MKFPWRKYSKKELLDEYNKLKDNLLNWKITTNLSYSIIGLKCSNYFFQYERIKTPSQGKISCYDFWKKEHKKIIYYYENGNTRSDLFATIIFFNHGPSQFPPIIAGQIYKLFNAKKILDPFAGWGDRCLAAMSLDIDYIGIDNNIKLKPMYKNMIEYYPTKSNVKMYFKNCIDVDLNKLDFDLVLTSPPYWNDKKKLLEKYYNTDDNYELFINNILVPFILKCKKKNKSILVCINMSKMMYEDVKKQIGKCQKILRFKTGRNLIRKNNNKTKKCIYCF
jgi:DNA modification methylase